MDRGTGVCVSPICIDRAMSGEGHEGSSSVSVSDTDMADPSMVSKTAGYGCGLSGVATTTKRYIAVTKTRMSPIGSGRKPAAGGLESVRHRAAAEGFQDMLPLWLLDPGVKEPKGLIIAPGINGVAGVVGTKLIRFKPLWQIN